MLESHEIKKKETKLELKNCKFTSPDRQTVFRKISTRKSKREIKDAVVFMALRLAWFSLAERTVRAQSPEFESPCVFTRHFDLHYRLNYGVVKSRLNCFDTALDI